LNRDLGGFIRLMGRVFFTEHHFLIEILQLYQHKAAADFRKQPEVAMSDCPNVLPGGNIF